MKNLQISCITLNKPLIRSKFFTGKSTSIRLVLKLMMLAKFYLLSKINFCTFKFIIFEI